MNTESDLNRYQFSIVVDRIATKMQSFDSKGSDSLSRRRKVPQTYSVESEVDPMIGKMKVIKERKRVRRSAKEENVWFDLVPKDTTIGFSRLKNGTVTEIRIPDEKHLIESDVTVGILKTLALLFNYNSNVTQRVVLESDDLGIHHSNFSFARFHRDDLRILKIDKSVQPNDFIKGQYEKINSGKIKIFQQQRQFIDYDTHAVLNCSGTVSTKGTETRQHGKDTGTLKVDERIGTLFKVEVKYVLKLTRTSFGTNPGSESPPIPIVYRRFDFTNFSPQDNDDSKSSRQLC